MKLVIVESPSKAKTISKYLGSGYAVVASGGHIRDLPVKTLGVNVDNNFQPTYITVQGKEKTIKEIQQKIKNSDEVFLATDPDREGEAISWHIQQEFKLNNNVNRIEFNEITKNAVNKAIENPRKIDIKLVDAQQARRILDRLVGYKVSPLISRKIRKGLSAGRVQSVALRIVIDKEKEIRAFVPEEYWNIFARISKENSKSVYKTLFVDIDGKKVKIKNEKECNEILDGIKKGNFFVDNIKKQVQISKSKAPFTTSTMQQDGVSKLGFSAPKISQLAQKLYEGIDIPELGTTALVTYIRTDSTRVSKEAQESARKFILDNFGDNYIPKVKPNYETKKGAQDAHEAIRPINVEITPASLKDKIDKDLYKLYKLIYERFMASQMSNAEYNTLNIHIISDSDKKYGFQLKGRSIKFDGYTRIYQDLKEETNQEEEDELNNLPQFEIGDKIICHEIINEQKFTNPPLRYTEASLIKKLEESGIGRPSTYSSIMQILLKRDYTIKQKKFIVPTELGEIVIDFLVKHFKDLLDIKFTSIMENKLDDIADGSIDWISVLKDFYPNFQNEMISAYNDKERSNLGPELTDIKCKKCSALMAVRTGKFGKFLGCSNYPNCDFTMLYGDIVSECPYCKSIIVKKYSAKSKSVYYTCANYKECKFMSFDIPAPFLCPKCSEVVKMTKTNSKITYKCKNQNCDYYMEKEREEDEG